MHEYTASEQAIVNLVSNTGTLLSLTGEIWIFYVFFKTWRFWTYSGKVILCLTFSYFIYTFANLLKIFNEKENMALCLTNGFLRTFSVLSSFYFAWRISKSAYSALFDPDYRALQHTGFKHLSKGFIYPIVFSFPPLVLSFFDFPYFRIAFQSFSCGVTTTTSDHHLKFFIFLFYVAAPAGLLLISTMYYSLKIQQYVRSLVGDNGISKMRFLVYPTGLFIVWTPTLVFICLNNLYAYIFWLDIVRIFATHSIGLLHSIIYGMQTNTLTKMERDEKNSADEQLLESSSCGSFDAEIPTHTGNSIL